MSKLSERLWKDYEGGQNVDMSLLAEELHEDIERLQTIRIEDQARWQDRLLESRAENERLTNALETERGHREADKREAREEIERLKADYQQYVDGVRSAEESAHDRLVEERNERETAARACYASLNRPQDWWYGERARLLMAYPWLKEEE